MPQPTITTSTPFRPPAALSPDRRRTPMLIARPGKIATTLRPSHPIGATHRCDTLTASSFNPMIGSFYRLAVHHPR